MTLILDTYLLIWTAFVSAKLSADARTLMSDPDNELFFSVVSLWEVGIKRRAGRADFSVVPRVLRRGLLDSDYAELPITGAHALAIDGMPLVHKDPFDRMLAAQALVEGITLLTVDPLLANYPCPARRV